MAGAISYFGGLSFLIGISENLPIADVRSTLKSSVYLHFQLSVTGQIVVGRGPTLPTFESLVLRDQETKHPTRIRRGNIKGRGGHAQPGEFMPSLTRHLAERHSVNWSGGDFTSHRMSIRFG